MTNYDPFSYGEVRLDADQQPGVTAQEAEDLLFADAAPDEQAAQPSATWERAESVAPAVEGPAPGLAASMDFGAEVLGEDGDLRFASCFMCFYRGLLAKAHVPRIMRNARACAPRARSASWPTLASARCFTRTRPTATARTRPST